MKDLKTLRATLGEAFKIAEVGGDATWAVAIKTENTDLTGPTLRNWQKALGAAGAKLDETWVSDKGENMTRIYEVYLLQDATFLIKTAKTLWGDQFLKAKVTISNTYEVSL